MFATFAGGYSRKPLPGLPDLLGQAERDLLEGRIGQAAYEAVADEFVREILAEMGVIELGIAGDGGVRAPDRVLPWIKGLDGLSAGDATTLPGGEPVTRPVVTDRVTGVAWTRPLTVRDWRFADGETDLVVKQTLVGPYSLASLAEPKPGRRRDRLAEALGEALNAEIVALSEAGCPMVEVDEPVALRIGDDAREWQTFRRANQRLSAGFEDPAGLHLSLGLWGGQIHERGWAPLIELPFKSYLVDVLAGPSAWRFIRAVPPERGVVAGAADVTTITLDETEVLIWAMAWAARGERGSGRVGIAPNGPLALLPRHFAHRKAQRCGESIKIALAGPLQDVAEALDDNPLRSKMAELRTMAEAVEAAGS
jgi:5-methyltetrahydropteroyltriglutamate--homocysteine methyltransferase